MILTEPRAVVPANLDTSLAELEAQLQGYLDQDNLVAGFFERHIVEPRRYWDSLSDEDRTALLKERDELEAEIRAQDRADRMANAEDLLRKKTGLIPRKYASALVDHPAIAGWIAEYLNHPDTFEKSLLLTGPVGVGKSHQAWAIYGAVARSVPHLSLEYRQVPRWLESLRPREDLSPFDEIDALSRAKLVILDDLGANKPSEWVEEKLFILIDFRYEHELPTVATTNVAPDKLGSVLGNRIASRLREAYQRIAIPGPDRRRI